MYDCDCCRECNLLCAESKSSPNCTKGECEVLFVKSLVTGYDLTKGKIYAVDTEYDTVYELQCDTGKYCRAKDFFEIV